MCAARWAAARGCEAGLARAAVEKPSPAPGQPLLERLHGILAGLGGSSNECLTQRSPPSVERPNFHSDGPAERLEAIAAVPFAGSAGFVEIIYSESKALGDIDTKSFKIN